MTPATPDASAPGIPAWSAWLDDTGLDGPVRAFAAVLCGQADSRSALSALLNVRSTTVSAWVAAMVDAGLVTETLVQPGGRGRPLRTLIAHPNRLTAQVVMVHSQSLLIAVVNLLGQVVWQGGVAIAADAGNAAMAAHLRAVQKRAGQYTPLASRVAGVAFSLSGLIDMERSLWVFTSRWPRIKNLFLPGCAVPAQRPVHVVRSMDAQLHARFQRRAHTPVDRKILLLHWGYGIGLAFGPPAPAIGDSSHGFGEVGHWKLQGNRKRCRCGQHGCLETEAALWAIGPRLLGARFDAAMTESALAALLQDVALVRHPVFKRALQQVVLVLVNLCRLFFPSEVVVSGPLIANAAVWRAVKMAFSNHELLVGLPMPPMERQGTGHQLEQEGAAMPLLAHGVKRLLDASL